MNTLNQLFLLLFCSIVGWGCARSEPDRADTLEFSNFPKAAAGRAAWVSPIEIIPNPKRFHGQRVILSGVWSSGFEFSRLDLENDAQNYQIWVEIDEAKIDESMGDLSDRLDRFGLIRESHDDSEIRITAEGTFYFRQTKGEGSMAGYGHRGASDAYFLVDRIFKYEPLVSR